MTLWQTVWRRLLQMAGLVFCGIAVAALVMWQDDYSQTHWVPSAAVTGLAVFTAITFSAVIIEFNRLRRKRVFWVALSMLLSAHLACYAIALRYVPDFRIPWFALITIVEIPILYVGMDRLLRMPTIIRTWRQRTHV